MDVVLLVIARGVMVGAAVFLVLTLMRSLIVL